MKTLHATFWVLGVALPAVLLAALLAALTRAPAGTPAGGHRAGAAHAHASSGARATPGGAQGDAPASGSGTAGPGSATPTPADGITRLDMAPPAAGPAAVPGTPPTVRVEPNSRLALEGGAGYTVDGVRFDPFVLAADGQAADGSPLLRAVESGVSYVTARVTPRCADPTAGCPQAGGEVTYIVSVGLSGSKEAAELITAQTYATAQARPTLPLLPGGVDPTAAAWETAVAGQPSPTPCPLVCPTDGVTQTPAGAGVIVSGGLGQEAAITGHLVGNEWVGRLPSGGVVWVIAGGGPRFDPARASKGTLAVRTAESWSFAIYPTPSEHGLVRVVSAAGEQLTLAARDGTTFVFDVPSRTYLPATAPAPTAAAGAAGTADAGQATAVVTGTQALATASPSPVATGAAPDLSNPTAQAAIAGGLPPPLLAATPGPSVTPATPTPIATALATAATSAP